LDLLAVVLLEFAGCRRALQHDKALLRIAEKLRAVDVFGPVLCVIPYDDEDEAIAIANDTNYGLQAYVEGADVAHARRAILG
jgi:acyl-CoA reductase-like NAD-dependent aldehyde dehydrogenase